MNSLLGIIEKGVSLSTAPKEVTNDNEEVGKSPK
jgi:hypothetical protein